MKSEVLDSLIEEDLTPDLKLISDIAGIDAVKSLLINAPSAQLYVPKIASLSAFILRYAEKNGDKSHTEIARDLGISKKYLLKLIFQKRKDCFKPIRIREVK